MNSRTDAIKNVGSPKHHQNFNLFVRFYLLLNSVVKNFKLNELKTNEIVR